MRASLGSIEVAVGAVAVLGIAALIYYNRKALATAVNPLNAKNLANRSANAVSRALTGHSPAVDLYNALHPNGGRSTTYSYDTATGKIVKTQTGGNIFNPANW